MPFVVTEGTVVAPVPSAAWITPRPSAILTYAGLSQSYEDIYRSQPNVRTVVDFVARNVAQLTLELVRRIDDDERRPEYEHPLAYLLRNPNPRTSRFAFFRDLVTDLGIFDDFYAIKVKAKAGREALVRYPPRQIEPVGGKPFPTGFRLLDRPGTPLLDAGQVVHVHGYNPDGDAHGVSPIETLRRILAEDISAGEYREQFWQNSARATSVITRPLDAPRWADDARRRFLDDWRDTYGAAGTQAGGTPILEDGMSIAKLSQTAQESEYLGARKLTRAEVTAAYHIPPSSVGIFDGATVSDMDSQHRALYQDALGPLLVFLQDELALQLLPDYVDAAEADTLALSFNIEDKLAGSFAEESEAMVRATGGPWLTRAEARAKRNLKPLPEESGADDLIVPLNVTTGGVPNPVDTVPVAEPLDDVAVVDTTATERTASRRALGIGLKDFASATAGLGELGAWVLKTRELVAGHVAAQAGVVKSRLGAGKTPAEAFGLDAETGRSDRWDTLLEEKLAGSAFEVAPLAGRPVAKALGSDFDLSRAEAWLRVNARVAAEEFNRLTVEAVSSAWSTPAAGAKAVEELEPTADELIAAAFASAGDERAGAFALDRTVSVANFARQEAGTQAGAGSKTWRTTAKKPRPTHAALNGVTISTRERFSNGGLWPGDHALTADERAGCTCTLEFHR